MSSSMLTAVRRYIAQHHLLHDEGHYLVALSGGADSVALLRVLLALRYDVRAAHCNFRLRAGEYDRDEAFCRDLCHTLGVPLHIVHFDTRCYASLHHVSLEMAARCLRYDYFGKLMADLNLDGVCVAHHRDDSVETLLLNLIRGTGVEGLKGIAPRNGMVLRPLLDVGRQDILRYLESLNQPFITDSSNLVDDVQRNKVRLNVIPELLKVNPTAVANIHGVTRRVGDALHILYKAIDEARQRVSNDNDGRLCVSISGLMMEHGAETVLWHLLKDKGFSSAQVEQVFANLGAQSGREWQSPTHALLIDRDTIVVEPLSCFGTFEMKLPEPGVYILPTPSGKGTRLRASVAAIGENFVVSRRPECACLDADNVRFPLTVRTARQGDAFVPFGMKGKKLLSDFLTDRKLSIFDKRRQLVVADAEGNIVWVVGIRPDNRCRITADTSSVLTLTVDC